MRVVLVKNCEIYVFLERLFLKDCYVKIVPIMV